MHEVSRKEEFSNRRETENGKPFSVQICILAEIYGLKTSLLVKMSFALRFD